MSEDMISEGGPVSDEAWERQRLRLSRAMNDLNVRASNAEEYADQMAAQAREARTDAERLSAEWNEAYMRLRRWEAQR